MSGPHPPLSPPFAFLDTAGGLGGGGGGDDNPRRSNPPSTHAVEANPVFPEEDDPNTNHGEYSDLASAAFPRAMSWRKKKRRKNLAPCRSPVCGKRFSHPEALYDHMRGDQMWPVLTPPVSEEEEELEGMKGRGVHGARNVRRGSGDEGEKQMRIGQKRSGAGRWKASKEAETAEAAAERRGLLPDLNLPVPAPEDTKDGSSSGIIDLNKKLPGQDEE